MEESNKYNEDASLSQSQSPNSLEEVVENDFITKTKSNPTINEVQTLTIDDINISLKVVGDLKTGSKLKILNGTYLAEDNSYINPITRYNTQCRDKIIIFLGILFSEVTRNVYILLDEIRNKINVDNNIHILQGLVYKVSVFLHNYETMRIVYKSDSGAFSKLGIIRDKFFMFLNTLFRDLTTYGTQ